MRKFLLFSAALLLTVGLATAQKQVSKSGKPSKNQNLVFPQSHNHSKATVWSENFDDETITDWTLYDEDGDNFYWGVAAYTEATCLSSASWDQTEGALTPENWAVSPAIDLTGLTDATFLEFTTWAQDPDWYSEHYKVLVSTTNNQVASFTENVFEETLPGSSTYLRTVSLNDYLGQTIYVAFVHYNCTDMFRLNLDDISVYTSTSVDLGFTESLSPNNESSCALSNAENVTVTIYNFGGAEATGFELSYSINGGAAVTEIFTGTLASGISADYTFAQTADLSGLDYYTIDFNLTIADDVDITNNELTTNVRSTDGELVVSAFTDFVGDQSWTLTNTNSEIIGSHIGYQWGIYEETTVCILDVDCYTFDFTGFDETGWIELSYNGTVIYGGETPGNTQGGVTWYGIGGGCAAVEISLDEISTPKYVLEGNTTISGIVQNLGSDNITSFDVTYSVDGGTESGVYSVPCDIATGGSYEFTHDTPYPTVAGNTYSVNITISNVNGGGETNLDNNILTSNVTALSYMPVRKIFGEQATGTWCGWCVRGHVAMEYMNETYPDTWVGVAVHNGDPMTNAYYDGQIRNYIEGYPSALVNRGTAFDPSEFEEYYNTEIAKVVPVSVEVTDMAWDAETRQVSFSVSAEFLAGMTDVRFNAVIAENNVTGTTTGYRQANYYSGGTYGPMGGYESLPNPVPAADMVYNNVAREILGGWNGTENSVPATVNAGETHAYQYTYSVSPDYDENEMYIVGLLIDQATGEVLNADKKMFITSNITTTADAAVSIYPNPAKDHINIELAKNAKVQISDISGKIVYTANAKAGNNKINTSNLSGIYFVQISDVDVICVKKLVISK